MTRVKKGGQADHIFPFAAAEQIPHLRVQFMAASVSGHGSGSGWHVVLVRVGIRSRRGDLRSGENSLMRPGDGIILGVLPLPLISLRSLVVG
jgi:hypothetical protein